MPLPIVINGRFLATSLSGVQRVAAELVGACDKRLGASSLGERREWQLFKPPNAHRDLILSNISSHVVGRTTWQAWEQGELAWAARDSLLVSLCNTSPILHPNSVVMIHDAQVFSSPQSYGRGLRTWYQWLLPRLARSARKILTVSDYSKTQLVAHGIAREDNILVVPNGVDHFDHVQSDLALALAQTRAPYVLAFSNAQAHKNIGVLLRAFNNPRMREIDLVLVGASTARNFSVKAGENVKFVGSVSDALLKGLMEQALCLAFPSLTEGFGLPPLEAMSAGCPTIVAPCGALPETCGSAALYADATKPDAWVEAILNLHGRGVQREELVQAGRLRAMQFRWGASAQRLLHALKHLDADPRR